MLCNADIMEQRIQKWLLHPFLILTIQSISCSETEGRYQDQNNIKMCTGGSWCMYSYLDIILLLDLHNIIIFDLSIENFS